MSFYENYKIASCWLSTLLQIIDYHKKSFFRTHNLEVPGSSPGWSTLKISNLEEIQVADFSFCEDNRFEFAPILSKFSQSCATAKTNWSSHEQWFIGMVFTSHELVSKLTLTSSYSLTTRHNWCNHHSVLAALSFPVINKKSNISFLPKQASPYVAERMARS